MLPDLQGVVTAETDEEDVMDEVCSVGCVDARACTYHLLTLDP